MIRLRASSIFATQSCTRFTGDADLVCGDHASQRQSRNAVMTIGRRSRNLVDLALRDRQLPSVGNAPASVVSSRHQLGCECKNPPRRDRRLGSARRCPRRAEVETLWRSIQARGRCARAPAGAGCHNAYGARTAWRSAFCAVGEGRRAKIHDSLAIPPAPGSKGVGGHAHCSSCRHGPVHPSAPEEAQR
jgi:hypothetical protein